MPSFFKNPLTRLQIVALGIAVGITASLTAIAAAKLPDRSREYYTVEGRLFIGDQPAAGAQIRLLQIAQNGSSSVAGWATPEADGSFQVFSRLARPGVRQGTYAVTVTWNAPAISGEDYLPGPNVMSKRYSLPSQTPLKIEVHPQNNRLPVWSLPVCDCGG